MVPRVLIRVGTLTIGGEGAFPVGVFQRCQGEPPHSVGPDAHDLRERLRVEDFLRIYCHLTHHLHEGGIPFRQVFRESAG